MKKLLIKLLLLLGLVAAFLALLLLLTFKVAGPQFHGEYTGAISDKIERLESIDDPKIVLVGNSNLAFGIDSERIEEAFGMPVVNLGGHGGLGNEFHINMGKGNINEGDVVIVSLTSYEDGGAPDADLAWITIENYGLWHLVPKECRSEMLKALPHYAFRVLGRWITRTGNKPRDGVYSIDSFNEYGDVVFPRPESVQGPIQQSAHPSAVGETADLINEYAAWCAERGAVCVVAGYPILRGQVIPPPPPAYDQFDAELREKLDCEVISVSRDYFMDQSYFYDTYYHLTDEGVAIRTEQLIEDLRSWEGAEQYLSPAP